VFIVLVQFTLYFYDLRNSLHCCVNDILSTLLYDCVKCPCLMKKVTFSSNRGGGVRFRITSWRDFGRLTLQPSYVTEPMHIHEPWTGQ